MIATTNVPAIRMGRDAVAWNHKQAIEYSKQSADTESYTYRRHLYI